MIVPAGAVHNLTNTGDRALHVYTLYGPRERRDGLVQKPRAAEKSAQEAFDGNVTEALAP